jgi:flagellar M-ring protein FliF
MPSFLAHLSVRQKVSIAAVALLLLAGIYAFVAHQREADFRPLLTSVPPEEAAAIVQKLKESGVEYRLGDNGGTISVPSARIAEMRLTLAAAGLPKTGRMGFELFDKTNLGATEFTEHVNFRRALEGELERSVMSLAEVEQARVHITFPKDSVFLDSQQPAKASVLVKLRPGARLSQQNVQAVNHLIASAVEGLSPDAVSVLDMNGNLLGRPRAPGGLDGSDASDAGLDYRHKVESDMVAKINSTLEPLLGANRYRAGVSVDCDFSGAEQSEEIFDPTRSVMLSSQRTEDATTGATSAGVPGTASALPRPASRPSSGSKGVSRMTENITYQTSRTVKKTRLPAGGIRKISVAVLVDQDLSWQPGKNGMQRVLTPPSPEKLKVIRDLVAGVTGLDEKRGDQLTVETLPFESTLSIEPPPASAPPAPNGQAPRSPTGRGGPALPYLERRQWIGVGAGAGVLVLLLAGGLFLRRRKRLTLVEAGAPELPPGSSPAAPAGNLPARAGAAGPPAAAGGRSPEEEIESRLAEREAMQQQLESQVLSSLKLAPVITKTAEVLAKHLREKIAKEPEVSAQVLRTWIREEDEV